MPSTSNKKPSKMYVPPDSWSPAHQMRLEAQKREVARIARYVPVVEIMLDPRTKLWIAKKDCDKHLCTCCGLPKVWYKEPNFELLHTSCPTVFWYRLLRLARTIDFKVEQLGILPLSPKKMIERIGETQTSVMNGNGKCTP